MINISLSFFFITISIGMLGNFCRQIFVDSFVPHGSYLCKYLYVRLIHWVNLQMNTKSTRKLTYKLKLRHVVAYNSNFM